MPVDMALLASLGTRVCGLQRLGRRLGRVLGCEPYVLAAVLPPQGGCGLWVGKESLEPAIDGLQGGTC